MSQSPAKGDSSKCLKHGISLEWAYESCSCEWGVREGEWDEPKWVKCFKCDGTGELSMLRCEACDEESYDY